MAYFTQLPYILLSFGHNYVARNAYSKSVAGFAIAERKMEKSERRMRQAKDNNNYALFARTGRRREVESSEVFGGGG